LGFPGRRKEKMRGSVLKKTPMMYVQYISKEEEER
jgi:hypothetical protein